MDKLTVVAWNAINGAPMVFEESALSVIAARDARIKELREALEQIAAIANKIVGSDWEEIDQARSIARIALSKED